MLAATYVGCSDDLVSVSLSSQQEDGLGDSTDPPRVQGKVGVTPVNALAVVELGGSNFACSAVSKYTLKRKSR